MISWISHNWLFLYHTKGYKQVNSVIDFCPEQDEDSATILALQDLSAPFSHDILWGWLQSLGLDNTDLRWLGSFLQGQSQSVLIGVRNPAHDFSSVAHHKARYSLHSFFDMKLLGEIIHYCGLRCHQCADDTQLFNSSPGNPSDLVATLSQWLEAVMACDGQMAFSAQKFKFWDSDIFSSGWGDTISGRLYLQFGCCPGLATPAVMTRKAFALFWVVCQLQPLCMGLLLKKVESFIRCRVQ